MTLAERIFKRILAESGSMPSTDDLAAYVTFLGENQLSFIYRPSVLVAALKSKKLTTKKKLTAEDFQTAVDSSGVAMIEIGPPQDRGQCHDASAVYAVAGPGYGDIAYAMGFSMSPSGILTSNRISVKDKAWKKWSKLASSGKGMSFDDIYNPKTPDPSDDCRIHDKSDEDCGDRDPGPLNLAHRAQGWEKSVADKLKKNHKSAMLALDALKIDSYSVQIEMDEGAQRLFLSSYFGK